MNNGPKVKRLEMNDVEVSALLKKASRSLSSNETEKLHNLVDTLKYITVELDKKRVSVKRLQTMLFGHSSEKKSSPRLKDILEKAAKAAAQAEDPSAHGSDGVGKGSEQQGSSPKSQKSSPRKGHGRRSAAEYSGGEHTHVTHPSIKPKDPCPKCPKGKLYKQKQPKVTVRLTGCAPIQAKVWSSDWYRCNLCGFIVNTPLPRQAGPPEKFDESVTSTIGMLRYGYGMPFNRLARLQEGVNIPLPASTQWDLIDRSAPLLTPVFTELIRVAAQGAVLYNDDTTMRVLEVMAELKASPPSTKKERVGVFTTGVISTNGVRKIALYLTGRQHAGENIGDVLARCDGLPKTIVQMSDGLSRNESKTLPEGLCVIHAVSHGRRKYVEIADSFPEQCLHVINELEHVYKADAEARKAKMSPEARLAHHQHHSKPVMDNLKKWLQQEMKEKRVEPNSAFGDATNYMLKRWERLTRFINVLSAPVDNNICERALKRAIRHRKNSLFYKTLHGARVGDIYMSLIHTCELGGVNPFNYLTALLREGEHLAEDPSRWMPWNYTGDAASGAA